MTLDQLFSIIKDRQQNPQIGSYTHHLMNLGEDAILKKVGEEAMEVILAAKSQGKQRLIEEVSDLFYHTLVLLAYQGVSLDEIYQELESRHSSRHDKETAT